VSGGETQGFAQICGRCARHPDFLTANQFLGLDSAVFFAFLQKEDLQLCKKSTMMGLTRSIMNGIQWSQGP